MSVYHVTSPSVIPSDHLSTCPSVELSVHHMDTSVCCTSSPSLIPSVSQLTQPSVALSVCDKACLSVIPIHPSYDQSVLTSHQFIIDMSICHPNRQSCDQSVRPSINIQLSVQHLTPSVRLSILV